MKGPDVLIEAASGAGGFEVRFWSQQVAWVLADATEQPCLLLEVLVRETVSDEVWSD